MQKIEFYSIVTFSDEEVAYFQRKLLKICTPAMKGDKKLFDEMCVKIPAFCEELYQTAKDMRWPSDFGPRIETPMDMAIYSVGANISAIILPLYRSYTAKSEALHKMVCDIIAEEKYEAGRDSFISLILPKTKRTDGIDIPRLLNNNVVAGCIITGCNTVEALLKLRDGRFVKEVQELQKRLTKDHWIVYRKKVALYLERYGQ